MTPIDYKDEDGFDHHLKRPEQPLSRRGLTITYDADSGTYHVSKNPDSTRSLTVMIVQTIATLTETDPQTLDPLANHIDPDHLEGLFNRDYPVNSQPPTVTFTYEGYQITIESPTEISVEPRQQ